MKRLITAIVALAVFLGLAAVAEAASTSTSLNVSFTAVATCTVSTTSVNFGSGTGLAIIYANGDVSVNCASGVPYNIALDAGLHYYPNQRHISNGTNSRTYILYKTADVAVAPQWGDSDYANTYNSGSSVADTGSGSAQAHTVYGELWSGGALPAGAYSDTVTVTVYY